MTDALKVIDELIDEYAGGGIQQAVLVQARARIAALSGLAGPGERAYEELRCSLSTIYGLAASKGTNALHDIACTALAGIARLKAMDQSSSPATAHPISTEEKT